LKYDKYQREGTWYIAIDGREYPLDDAGKKLNLSHNVLIRAVTKYKKGVHFNTYIEDMLWKVKNKIPLHEVIKIVSGRRVTTTLVMRKANVKEGVAWGRIRAAVAGKMSYVRLMRTADPKAKERGVKSHTPPEGKVPVKCATRRKKVSEIRPLGSWEKEQLKSGKMNPCPKI